MVRGRACAIIWRTNLAVALAVMAASAVLTGALLVGDSMRGSLRHLLLDQLGPIDEVLVTDRFFRAELADELDVSAHVSRVLRRGRAGDLRAGQRRQSRKARCGPGR